MFPVGLHCYYLCFAFVVMLVLSVMQVIMLLFIACSIFLFDNVYVYVCFRDCFVGSLLLLSVLRCYLPVANNAVMCMCLLSFLLGYFPVYGGALVCLLCLFRAVLFMLAVFDAAAFVAMFVLSFLFVFVCLLLLSLCVYVCMSVLCCIMLHYFVFV